ncbi:MAG TPA: potassium uptake protein, TrkH family [Candidatus Flavonifractor avistercoris]|nr:potassium uptake protein, TrkH family [Candidatus Flavonifractor avistercoris]
MLKRCALWLRNGFVRGRSLNATRIVAASFAIIILAGALLLTLPIASRDGQSAGFFTGLFTATSSSCVTGLILVDTWTQWTLFGQIVILAMIQLGGLGFMTVVTLLSFALHRRIGLSERLIMVSTLNLNDMDGVVRVVRHALMGTFLLEGAGAALMSLRLVPDFGLAGGLWRAVFHSVSAFCNAGFDLLGGRFGAFSSLAGYQDSPIMLGTTAALIAIGGLGFFVWEDILRARCWGRLSVYSKMVLLITGLLIVGGAAFFFLEEYHNPATLGDMPVWEKALNALFQSVTLRTAGFDAIGQGGLSESSKAMSTILMLIGGSSGSTAGGIKTATVAVLLLALRANLRGREQVTFRGRAIPFGQVLNAMTLTLVVLFVFLIASMVISTVEGLPYLNCAYEVASAMGTVGLTTGITPELTRISQSILIVLMYLGRVGILSFSIALMTGKRRPAKLHYPEINVMIG